MTSEKHIGLDVHQATISVAVMDASGKLVMESSQDQAWKRVPTHKPECPRAGV